MFDDLFFDDGMACTAGDDFENTPTSEWEPGFEDEPTSEWEPGFEEAPTQPWTPQPQPDQTTIIEPPDHSWPEGPEPSVEVKPQVPEEHPGAPGGGDFDYYPEEPQFPDLHMPSDTVELPIDELPTGIDELPTGMDELPELEVPDFFIP